MQEALSKGLDIVIVGDNDFYSQRAKVSCYHVILIQETGVCIQLLIMALNSSNH